MAPGLVIAPELLVIPRPDGKDMMELDAVVLGPKTVYIGLHKSFVRDQGEVCVIASCADLLKDLPVFAGKEVVPVFMAEVYESVEVEAKVQAACNKLGVLRFVRSGDTLHIEH